jgi:hypothetical protein
MHNGGNDAKLKTRLSKSSPFEVKMLVEFIRRGISVYCCAGDHRFPLITHLLQNDRQTGGQGDESRNSEGQIGKNNRPRREFLILEKTFRNGSSQMHKRWFWFGALCLILLLFSCLILLMINSGPGFGWNVQESRIRVESDITNSPFCGPDILCPITVILPKHHWFVWIIFERQTSTRLETSDRKLIDMTLWY